MHPAVGENVHTHLPGRRQPCLLGIERDQGLVPTVQDQLSTQVLHPKGSLDVPGPQSTHCAAAVVKGTWEIPAPGPQGVAHW